MSIVKSTKSGRSAIPVTIEDIIRLGYVKKENNKGGKRSTHDKFILEKGQHFLYIQEPKLQGEQERVYWRYISRISECKFFIETFADLDLVESYYGEFKPNKRNKIRDRILDDPRTDEQPTVWSTQEPGGTLLRNGKLRIDNGVKVKFVKLF